MNVELCDEREDSSQGGVRRRLKLDGRMAFSCVFVCVCVCSSVLAALTALLSHLLLNGARRMSHVLMALLTDVRR